MAALWRRDTWLAFLVGVGSGSAAWFVLLGASLDNGLYGFLGQMVVLPPIPLAIAGGALGAACRKQAVWPGYTGVVVSVFALGLWGLSRDYVGLGLPVLVVLLAAPPYFLGFVAGYVERNGHWRAEPGNGPRQNGSHE